MSSSATFTQLLKALAVGAAVGILLAPHSGKKTRKKIARRTRKLVDDVQDKAHDIAGPIKDGFKQAKENLANS